MPVSFRSIAIAMPCLIASALFAPVPAAAVWSTDATENNPVCTLGGDQYFPNMLADGAGGCFLTWMDLRDGTCRIYAQRLDADGAPLWAAGGVRVCTYDSEQVNAEVAPDGAGGLIVVWEDTVGDDDNVFAQRLDADGNLLWNAYGEPVVAYTGDQSMPQIAADGSGGAVMAWEDHRSASEVYAQRLDAAGTRLWGSAGTPVCAVAASVSSVRVDSDGGGGAVIAWNDWRSGSSRVYAQRLDAGGAVLWTVDGEVLSTTSSRRQYAQAILGDGAGGAFVAFLDALATDWSDGFLLLQHLDASGAALWTAGGERMHEESDYNHAPVLLPDGGGGLYAVWDDGYGEIDILAQHFDADADRLWGNEAALVCGQSAAQTFPTAVLADDGGLLVAWRDRRHGDYSVYTQRLDGWGGRLWAEDGVAANLASSYWTSALASDGRGGLIAAWPDQRGADIDVYAQRVDRNGFLGEAGPAMTAVTDRPDDQGGELRVEWAAGYPDAMPWHAVVRYSVWVRPATAKAAAAPPPADVPALASRLGCSAGEIAALVQAGWTFAAEVPAVMETAYGCFAPSFGDSTANGVPLTECRVIAHGADPWIFWEAPPLAGTSVDNLAPGAPLNLAGDYVAVREVDLTWEPSGVHDEDLALYRVYRGTAPGFPLDAAHLWGTSLEPAYRGPAGSGDAWWRVTAVDAHGNASPGSDEVLIADLTGAPTPPAAFALRGNRPNPFNPSTEILFDLPEPVEIRLTVYAPDGRRLVQVAGGGWPAGSHAVTWDGRDARGRRQASGVYLARLDAGRHHAVHRMLLLK